MSHLLYGAALVAALVLSGCSNTASPATRLSPPPSCGASLLQNQIGKAVTGTSAGDAHVGGDPVQSRGSVRIFKSGQPVTHDYREALATDATGHLRRATCG